MQKYIRIKVLENLKAFLKVFSEGLSLPQRLCGKE